MVGIINKRFSDPVFQLTIILSTFILAYWVPIYSMVHTWLTNDDYSYGILIPCVSAYFIWEQRKKLKGIPVKSNWLVFPVLILFVLISIYGILGSSGHISRPALPVLISLFAIFCFGYEFFKKFSLPLVFLVFMIPLPVFLDRTLGVFLKAISSQMGAAFIKVFGISVHVSGNIIDLGVSQLQVVDACSGLRFLFPLMALGVVYAYFFEKILWKRILCVAITPLVAIVTNAVRIGITGLLTRYVGSHMAEGFFHDLEGWLIFMVSFVLIFLFGRFLRLFPPKQNQLQNEQQDLNENNESEIFVNQGNQWAIYTSLVMLLCVFSLSLSTHALPPVMLEGGIKGFPKNFDAWKGTQNKIDPKITEASGAEEAFNAFYTNDRSERVSLYMGYRSSAFMENENFFHSPTVCLPSSGLKTESLLTHTVHDTPMFGDLSVTEMIVSQGNQKQLVYFWFQTKDVATHNKDINRFHLAMHAIRRDNTYDLFIRTITSIKGNETLDSARERMDKFVRQMMHTLHEFVDAHQFMTKDKSN